MSPLEAVVVVGRSFLVALAGGAVGLVLGNIRLPVILLVASSPAAGGGANIAISGVAATAAAAGHLRAGRVNWRLFAWMAPPSVAGALVGGYLAGVVPERALLLTISAVLLYSGFDLVRAKPPAGATGPPSASRLDIRAAVISGLASGCSAAWSASSSARFGCRRCSSSWARFRPARSART